MRSVTQFEIAIELITWNARLEVRKTRLGPLDRDWRDQFADYMLYRDRHRHLHDVQGAVGAFVERYPLLWDWYKAVREEGEIAIHFHERRATITLDGFAKWRAATARIDHDALLTHALLDQYPAVADPVPTLSGWGVFPTGHDHGLERVLQRGMADTHVHFEASDPIPLLWARLVHGYVELDDIPRYSNREMSRITVNPERLEKRSQEKWLIADALVFRRQLDEVLFLRLPVPTPGAFAFEYLINERRFLLAAWRALRDGRLSPSDEHKWDSYLFAKSMFHSEQQQFPGSGAGLSRFRQYLDRGESLTEARMGKICKRAQKSRMRRLVDFATESSDVRLIELRIAPKKRLRDYFTFLSLWNRLLAEHPRLCPDLANPVRIGFIVHFIRKPEDHLDDIPLFSKLRCQLDRATAELHQFRVKHQALARHIVGIDVANTERGCPPEIFSPFLKQLRGQDNLFQDGAMELTYWKRLHDSGIHHHPIDLPVLGQTYHVGEDYYHIADGLRHMDCVGRYLLCGGDRIGHGLALGDNASQAVVKRGAEVHIMQGILIDNLAWLYDRAMREGLLSHADAAKVETAIHRLSQTIYGAVVEIPLLVDLQRRRYGLPPQERTQYQSRVDELFAHHIYDPHTRKRRHAWADREPTKLLDELHPVITRLQDVVVHSMRKRGIIIEANPTSNLATGAVASMADHPLLRFLPGGAGAGLFSVNTDDPGVFATRIENEYALVFAALLEVMDRPAALAAVDALRQTGLDSSFLRRMATG